MPDLKINFSVRPPALVRQGGVPGHVRTLQNANNEALRHLGWPMDLTNDAKGRVLRQLRLQMGIDPSVLATQACMSLSQLYQLEDGSSSRFYSDSLRRQAGRRVARLLGVDWDRMDVDELVKSHGHSNNVVHLQLMTAPLPLDTAPPVSATVPIDLPAPTAPPEVPAAKIHAVQSLAAPLAEESEERTVAMGLAVPACETLLVESPGSHFASSTSAHQVKKSSGWSTLMTMLLVIVLGAAGGYAFAEYSPYRLYWPW